MSLLEYTSGLPSITDIQRQYNFEVILPDIWDKGLATIATGWFIGKYVQAISFGQYNIEEISEMLTGPTKKFFPERMNIGSPKLTFVTPVPDVVTFYLQSWKGLIIDDRKDKKGFYFPSNHYKKNIYIILFDRTGIPSNVITLKGAFPITFPAYNLDYKAEDNVMFDIEFRIDSIDQGLSALGQGLTGLGTALQALSKKRF
jgi:hypothetical protein